MNVRTKLRGAFAIYIALLAGLSLYHVRTTRRAVESGHALTAIASRLRATSTVQLGRLDQAGNDARKYLVTRDSGYLAELQQTIHEYDAELRHLDSLPLSRGERAVLSPLAADWEHAVALSTELAGKQPDSAATTLDALQQSLDRVHNETQALAAASQDAMARELAASEAAEREAEQVTLAAAGGAVLLSILLSALLARSILDPLARLAEGTREVSAGRFGHRLTPSGRDELAQLAREFNAMTERLDELDRMKHDFVSKVSHDLKTPLSSMQETTSVLLDEVAGPLTPKQQQLLRINHESGQRLYAMITKLLDLSRIEAGLETERVDVELEPLVRRSVDRLAEGGAADRVSVATPERGEHLLVRGDPEALAQVFDNLLDNALKFSPFDGRVRVAIADLSSRGTIPPERWAALRRSATPLGAVLVTVTDEGPGIPDDDKLRVFDRFFQTDAGRSARSRGVGLGLAICREIVAAHGGSIWVSDNEPRGSVFHVLLPASGTSSPRSAPPMLVGQT